MSFDYTDIVERCIYFHLMQLNKHDVTASWYLASDRHWLDYLFTSDVVVYRVPHKPVILSCSEFLQ